MNNEIAAKVAAKAAGSEGRRRFLLWLSVALAVVVADQVTKWLIVQNVPLFSKIPVTSFINITHQENPGAAFSFLADAGGWQRWFFAVLAAVVSLFILHWLWQLRLQHVPLLAAGLTLVLGGAIGNLVDRLLHGHVIDFIQVLIYGWPFPSFNVADAGISVGAGLLIVDALFFAGKREETEYAE